MKFMVTGGAGFIGSHLVDRLVEMGEVVVLDNLSLGKKENIAHHLSRAGFSFIEADLLDGDNLARAVSGCDVVFHLAANSDIRASAIDTRIELNQNIIATYNVLEAMHRGGVGKIIFTSSSAVYGETYSGEIPEDYSPLRPISMYGAGKMAAEGLISAFCNLHNMQAWVFRLANIVGSRFTHGVIYDFVGMLKKDAKHLKILGDGKQAKPYLHVQDCVGGMLYGYKNSTDRINTFNLSTRAATSVKEIARLLLEELGLADVEISYTGGDRGWPGDVPQVRLDPSRMEAIGWKQAYTSDEAVRQAIRDILGKAE